jgi:uncharacterized protein
MKTIELIKKMIRFGFILPIRIYQYTISPLLPKSCRHEPTCSEYTIQAVKVHGIAIGFWLGIKRIARCHPWGTSGYDPVPPKGTKMKDLIFKMTFPPNR